MNYARHYQLLIDRARTREPVGYFERHHVIPRCLGGGDEPENIVRLTPEEHYLAHQLLVKMHPGHVGLLRAAMYMGSSRPGLRYYGWLRRAWANAEVTEKTRSKLKISRARQVVTPAMKEALRVHRHAPKSAEHRAKIAESNKGKRLSLETIEKIRLTKTGKPSPKKNNGLRYTVDGITLSAPEWSELFGLKRGWLWKVVYRGHDPIYAIRKRLDKLTFVRDNKSQVNAYMGHTSDSSVCSFQA